MAELVYLVRRSTLTPLLPLLGMEPKNGRVTSWYLCRRESFLRGSRYRLTWTSDLEEAVVLTRARAERIVRLLRRLSGPRAVTVVPVRREKLAAECERRREASSCAGA